MSGIFGSSGGGYPSFDFSVLSGYYAAKAQAHALLVQAREDLDHVVVVGGGATHRPVGPAHGRLHIIEVMRTAPATRHLAAAIVVLMGIGFSGVDSRAEGPSGSLPRR
jgi:hypothetical protein